MPYRWRRKDMTWPYLIFDWYQHENVRSAEVYARLDPRLLIVLSYPNFWLGTAPRRWHGCQAGLWSAYHACVCCLDWWCKEGGGCRSCIIIRGILPASGEQRSKKKQKQATRPQERQCGFRRYLAMWFWVHKSMYWEKKDWDLMPFKKWKVEKAITAWQDKSSWTSQVNHQKKNLVLDRSDNVVAPVPIYHIDYSWIFLFGGCSPSRRLSLLILYWILWPIGL